MSKKAVLGIAKTRLQAEALVDRLHNAGFSYSDVSIIFSDKNGAHNVSHENSTKAPEGATAGASAGGILGGTLGLLAGIGTLAIPGLGPLVAAGPILATLSGFAVGAAVGGVAGALIGLGIPEYEAKIYESRLQEGNILIAVHTENNLEIDRAKGIFAQSGAEQVSTVTETDSSHYRKSAG